MGANDVEILSKEVTSMENRSDAILAGLLITTTSQLESQRVSMIKTEKKLKRTRTTLGFVIFAAVATGCFLESQIKHLNKELKEVKKTED